VVGGASHSRPRFSLKFSCVEQRLAHHAGLLHLLASYQRMPHPSSETITFSLSESEYATYTGIVMKRQEKLVPSGPRWLSAIIVPLVLAVLLMAASALRDKAGQAEFGLMLVIGTIGYLGGFFGLRFEIMQEFARRRSAAFRTDPSFRELRRVGMLDAGLKYESASITAHYSYHCFSDVELTHDFILAWVSSASSVLVPIRCFASRTEAKMFADDLRCRINAARAMRASDTNPGQWQ